MRNADFRDLSFFASKTFVSISLFVYGLSKNAIIFAVWISSSFSAAKICLMSAAFLSAAANHPQSHNCLSICFLLSLTARSNDMFHLRSACVISCGLYIYCAKKLGIDHLIAFEDNCNVLLSVYFHTSFAEFLNHFRTIHLP